MRSTLKTVGWCLTVVVACTLTGCSEAGGQSGSQATSMEGAADTVSTTSENAAIEAAVAAIEGSGTGTVGEVVTQAASVLKEPHSVDQADTENGVDLHFNGTGPEVVPDGVSVEGATVTISQAGTYVLSGTLEGNVLVQAPEDAKVSLILDGVSINSATTSALAILSADEVTVQLASDSRNALTNAQVNSSAVEEEAEEDSEEVKDADEEPNATLYSTADLSITGDGELEVAGNQNDGIGSKDGLVIDAGVVFVTAADDGIRGKDYVVISGGNITVESTGHAIKSDNTEDATKGFVLVSDATVVINSKEDDGINAQYVLLGAGTNTTISAGDDAVHGDLATVIDTDQLLISASVEGIEGAGIVLVNGTIDVTSTDDGINASDGSGAGNPGGNTGGNPGAGNPGMMGSSDDVMLLISGGVTTLRADGDGIDSNGSAEITGGSVTVNGPTHSGNGAIDVASGLMLSGGTLIAGGASGMAEAPSQDSTQGWVWANITASVGQEVQLLDSTGTVLVTYEPVVDVGNIVFSAADIVAGETYQIQVLDGEDVANTVDVVAGEADQAGGMGQGFGGGDRGGGPGGEGFGGENFDGQEPGIQNPGGDGNFEGEEQGFDPDNR